MTDLLVVIDFLMSCVLLVPSMISVLMPMIIMPMLSMPMIFMSVIIMAVIPMTVSMISRSMNVAIRKGSGADDCCAFRQAGSRSPAGISGSIQQNEVGVLNVSEFLRRGFPERGIAIGDRTANFKVFPSNPLRKVGEGIIYGKNTGASGTGG